MKVGSIKFKIIYKDADLVEYELIAENHESKTTINFYANFDDLQLFGEELLHFPFNKREVIFGISKSKPLKEPLGEMIGRWFNPMKDKSVYLRVFTKDHLGHSLIQIYTDNLSPIEGNQSNFYISAEPASINNLGDQLKHFDVHTDSEIKWESNE